MDQARLSDIRVFQLMTLEQETIALEGTDPVYDAALAYVHAEMAKIQQVVDLAVTFMIAPMATFYCVIRGYRHVRAVLKVKS